MKQELNIYNRNEKIKGNHVNNMSTWDLDYIDKEIVKELESD